MLSDLLDQQLGNEEKQANLPQGEGVTQQVEPKTKKNRIIFGKPDLAKIKKVFSKETVDRLEEEGKVILSMLSFFGLLLVFLVEIVWKGIGRIRGISKLTRTKGRVGQGKLGRKVEGLIERLESKRGGVRRSFLIALAFRNMQTKRTRSFVTVGGMSVGIGAIVFLVSVGYGLQRLVVSRVARLEELRQADVTQAQAANVKIDETALQTIQNIPGVEKISPVVSLVGKVSFEGSVSESVVYGVTGDYLTEAGLNKLEGEFFETKDKQALLPDIRVAGARTEWSFTPASYGKQARKVVFNLEPETYLRVRKEPNAKSEILGYVKRVEGGFEGVEYWGESYAGDPRGREGKNEQGEELGRWIKAPFPLWEQKGTLYEPLFDSERVQEWKEGYIAELSVVVDEDASSYVQWDEVSAPQPQVLGEATNSASLPVGKSEEEVVSEATESALAATVVGVDESGVEWVTLGDEATAAAASVLVIEAPDNLQKEAVVNQAFIELLGLEKKTAIGSSFEIGFVILNTLKPDLDRPAESEVTKYIIRAVIEEGSSPVIYVPITDITSLGITNYSQAKLTVKDKGELSKVRQQVDNLGYKTTSVADTVAQIDRLFGTARAVLATFGLVALVVASLGMFNTLTVSLMERTREVGVMKAMGMQSQEVKELFLAEAMVMGILGGVFGVLMGFVAGKMLGVVLSAFAIVKGVGWIDVSYIPPLFVAFVLLLSFIVGVVTGIYPARRATKISALDALRYE